MLWARAVMIFISSNHFLQFVTQIRENGILFFCS